MIPVERPYNITGYNYSSVIHTVTDNRLAVNLRIQYQLDIGRFQGALGKAPRINLIGKSVHAT